VGKGEAFGYKNLGYAAKLIARMLRPYRLINKVISNPKSIVPGARYRKARNGAASWNSPQ